MNLETVKSALIGVVKDIQRFGGHDESKVSGGVYPVKDLPSFDSQICIEAMSMLSSSLGVDIPLDRNIFATKDKKQLLTIDEASAVVYEGLRKGEK
jgi:hypothetical protein